MNIRVEQLSFKVKDGLIDRVLLNNITHQFENSKITNVSVLSESGNKTFLYALAGILKKVDGKVVVLNESIYDYDAIQRDNLGLNNISIIFQNLNLLFFMSVESNILLPIYLKKQEITEEIKQKISEYLNILGLGQIQSSEISKLSNGEQQRIAIIRALINEPNIVICDEPTRSLDKENTIKFIDSIRKISNLEERTIIIVTLNKEVFNYGDNQVEMMDGCIIT